MNLDLLLRHPTEHPPARIAQTAEREGRTSPYTERTRTFSPLTPSRRLTTSASARSRAYRPVESDEKLRQALMGMVAEVRTRN